MTTAAPFLTAEWRWLAMLNYEADAALLRPLVPAGTELDTWGGVTYASVVGFLFLDTRVLGVPIPFHRDFEELNLRFYVRRRGPWGAVGCSVGTPRDRDSLISLDFGLMEQNRASQGTRVRGERDE